MNWKKLSLMVAGATTVLTSYGFAADQDVDAEAEFRQAISLTKNADVDFTTGAGVIEFTGTPGASDLVSLGTDGNIAVGGTAFTAPSTGTAGDVDITGDGSSNVEVSCTDTATISDGTNNLTVNMEIAMDTGVAYGSGTDCAGLGTTPLTHTLDGTDKILVGGQIVGNSGTVTSAVYNTTNSGGSAATVRVVYQ
ncbi:MAG: hypothetical protein OXR68_07460 [Alphaproteobacteria bacterium]|nr:hypothetical protein [Alphaproteobacteria bacterium]MDD9920440.1 hypothetical protein [Alphaproteobacteria bacterium]